MARSSFLSASSGRDHLFQRVFEEADAVVRIVGGEDDAGQPVAEVAGLQRLAHDRLAVEVGGRAAHHAEGKDEHAHQHAAHGNGKLSSMPDSA